MVTYNDIKISMIGHIDVSILEKDTSESLQKYLVDNNIQFNLIKAGTFHKKHDHLIFTTQDQVSVIKIINRYLSEMLTFNKIISLEDFIQWLSKIPDSRGRKILIGPVLSIKKLLTDFELIRLDESMVFLHKDSREITITPVEITGKVTKYQISSPKYKEIAYDNNIWRFIKVIRDAVKFNNDKVSTYDDLKRDPNLLVELRNSRISNRILNSKYIELMKSYKETLSELRSLRKSLEKPT